MSNDETAKRPNYVMADSEHDGELRRLRWLQEIRDPDTFDYFQQIGIGPGWRCVDVGAGAGSVARHLSEIAGVGGLVVAADMDTRFLQDFDGPGRETRLHDLVDGPIEPGDFDLAHCRALLTHLEDPRTGIDHLRQSVRSGGWVLCEEPDYISMEACEAGHPFAGDLATFRAIMTLNGRQDAYIGRRIRNLFNDVGLRGIRAEGRVRIVTGGSPDAMFRSTGIENTRHLLRNSKYFDDAGIDRLLEMFGSPDFSYLDATWVATWGQVP